MIGIPSVLAAFNTADGSHLVAGSGKDGYLQVVDRATGQLRFKAPIVSRFEIGTTAIPTTAYVRFCPVTAAQWNGPEFSPAGGFLSMNGIDWCGSAIKGPSPTYLAGKEYLGLATPNGFPALEPIDQAFGLVNAFDPKDGRLIWREIQRKARMLGKRCYGWQAQLAASDKETFHMHPLGVLPERSKPAWGCNTLYPSKL